MIEYFDTSIVNVFRQALGGYCVFSPNPLLGGRMCGSGSFFVGISADAKCRISFNFRDEPWDFRKRRLN